VTQQPHPNPYSQQGSAEHLWRRPEGVTGAGPRPPEPQVVVPPPYAGPPRPVPARPEWRPRTLIEIPPAHKLPPQDDAALDEREKEARTVTYGVGMITGAVALIIMIILCGRALF
jgi:hypothetical protein